MPDENGFIILLSLKRAKRAINFCRCDATRAHRNSLILGAFHRYFVSVQRDSSHRNLCFPRFLSLIFVRKWAMSIRELCGWKQPVFLRPANRTAIVARQSSQTQDIKDRLRSSTSGSAIHRIIVAVVQPDLLMHRNICFERKLSYCKIDVTRWSVYVQFREAY